MLNQHSKKHHRAGTPNVVPDPLVDPGNPSHRYQARSTAHLERPCSRMVALATSSPGRRSPRSPPTKNATVMLAHAAGHEAPDEDLAVKPQRPNHRASHPVRFGDQGVVGNIDPVIFKADSIVAALRFPINIADSKAVRERTT